MFEKIRSSIERLMFGKAEEQSKIAISSTMDGSLSTWLRMYQMGGDWVDRREGVVSLQLPAVISSEFARLITSEFEFDIQGDKRAEYLSEQFDRFTGSLRTAVGRACALGGVVFKPFVSGNGEILVDLVRADQFIPLEFDNNRMTSGLFMQRLVRKDGYFVRLEKHTYKNGVHEVENKAYYSKREDDLGREIPLVVVPEWAELVPLVVIENVTRPLFAYYKMPLDNTVDLDSPLGVSVFDQAIDLIRQADLQYSFLAWEYEGGQLAVDVSEDLLDHDPSDLSPSVPQRQARLYRNRGLTQDRNFYEVFSPALRDESYIKGFDNILKRIEFNCGLAYGTLSDPSSVAKTATEILTHKQRSFSTVKDMQKSLEMALDDLLYAMGVLCDLYKLVSGGEIEYSFDWGDSVMANPNERKMMFWQYVQAGKFPFWKYLVEFERYTEEEAKALAEEQSQASMSAMSLFPSLEG